MRTLPGEMHSSWTSRLLPWSNMCDLAWALTQSRSATNLLCLASAIVMGCGACREPSDPIAHIHERWYQPQVGWANTRPGILGDVVFFGTGDGQIIARRQSSGVALWTSKIANEMISGANMVARDGIVVVPVVHETVALDASTGHELWRYSAPPDTTWFGPATTTPGQVVQTHIASDGGAVYIPAWGASVSSVELSTGVSRWVWRASPVSSDTAARGMFRSGSMGVAVSGDTVYAIGWHFRNALGGESEAWLVALDRLTGRELWRITMPWYSQGAFVWGAPVVRDKLVIFEIGAGHEYGVDRFSREIAWEYKPNPTNATRSSTEFFDGIVYHDGGDGYLYGLHAADGTLAWRGTSTVFLSGAVTSRDMLITPRRVVYSNGGMIHVLDRQTGREIAYATQPRTSDPLIASPAAYANGQVFVTVGEAAWSFDEP
jgi:outer membrane protein assembly factor BamB